MNFEPSNYWPNDTSIVEDITCEKESDNTANQNIKISMNYVVFSCLEPCICDKNMENNIKTNNQEKTDISAQYTYRNEELTTEKKEHLEISCIEKRAGCECLLGEESHKFDIDDEKTMVIDEKQKSVVSFNKLAILNNFRTR